MGIDYRGVGGIGIEVTEDMIDEAIERKYPDDEFYDDASYTDKLDSLLSKSSLMYETAGNSYCGEDRFYLLVPGSTLREIQENVPVFCEGLLQVFNIEKDPADLEVISDMLVY